MPDRTVLNREQFVNATIAESRQAIPPIRISTKLLQAAIYGDNAKSSWSEVTEYSVRDTREGIHRLRYAQSFESQLARVRGKWLIHSVSYPTHAKLWLDSDPVSPEELKHRIGK